MTLWSPTAKELFEPIPIEDDFCTQLAAMECVAGCTRLVFAVQQTAYETHASMLVVRRKLILPFGAIGPAVQLASAFMARRKDSSAHREFSVV